MRNRLKYITVLFFLLLAILPSFTPILLQLKEKAWQKKIWKEMELHSLITIRIMEEDFSWVEEGKEIRIGDLLFDVRSYHYQNGQYTVTGLFDEVETALVDRMHKTQEEDLNNKKVLVEFFQLFETITGNQLEETTPALFIGKIYNRYAVRLCEKHCSIIIPPPRC